MNPNEMGFTVVLAAVLLGVAAYFGRQQLRTLRGLKALDADDRNYLRPQAYRRLVCSALMVLFAGLLIGGLFINRNYEQLSIELRMAQEQIPATAPTEEQKNAFHLFLTYLIVALLVLLALATLAIIDFWATTRFWLRQHRKLQADHRAQLQAIAAQRRQDRNGQQER